nr:group II intron maturase-specific domain-containing protein [Acetobacter aceti]
MNAVDMIASLNRRLAGWAAFYRFTDFTARTFRRIDTVVFWKLAHWLAQKYRSRIGPLMRKWYRVPETEPVQDLAGLWTKRTRQSCRKGAATARHEPESTIPVAEPRTEPYIYRDEARSTVTSRYHDVAMALSPA